MNALRPVFLPGEEFQVKIVKEGEGDSQGVGYLDDGTMIVIEGGRNYLQEMAIVSVTSVLQTSAGRMIFANFEGVSWVLHPKLESLNSLWYVEGLPVDDCNQQGGYAPVKAC